MDLSQLEDILEEDTYIPTFNKAPRPSNQKSLTKNDSVKSIQNALLTPTAPPRGNLLQIHKDTRKQVTTFQDFFKQKGNQPKIETKPQITAKSNDSWNRSKQPVKQDNYGIDNLLDEEDDVPIIGQRKMKPPINRKNDDNKSVANDNKSVTSVTENKRDKQVEKLFNNFSSPAPLINTQPIKPGVRAEFKSQNTKELIKQNQQFKQSNDNLQIRKILEQQLQLQRNLSQRLLKQEGQSHKNEVQRLKSYHQQELKRKLQLKDLEIEKLKEFNELQLKVKFERDGELKDLSVVSQRVEQGIKALERAGQDIKSRTTKFQQQKYAKSNQIKGFEQFTKQKERYIQQLLSKVEQRQKQFKQQKQRMLGEIDRDRKRLQDQQSKIYKKQRQLEEKFMKKERKLIEQYQEKERKMQENQSKARLEKMQIQQEKLQNIQMREQYQSRQRKWDQSRKKLMEEMQLEKAKLMKRQVELTSKDHEWEFKQSEITIRQRQMTGKLKLIELQRKKWEVQRQMKRKTINIDKPSYLGQQRQPVGPSIFQKSIKQLKDQYLKNLGHI